MQEKTFKRNIGENSNTYLETVLKRNAKENDHLKKIKLQSRNKNVQK